MYEKGDGIVIDLARAEEFYRIGADNGNVECLYIVAKLLEVEDSKNPNVETAELALKYKKEAADRGHPAAAAEMGYHYSANEDPSKAKLYFESAKKNASPNTTITVSLQQLASYNAAAEEERIANK
jgi:TPR repeat protein